LVTARVVRVLAPQYHRALRPGQVGCICGINGRKCDTPPIRAVATDGPVMTESRLGYDGAAGSPASPSRPIADAYVHPRRHAQR